eukprot:scaffold7207_cov62-Phaeocystis_antarctica.AAC.9
MLPYVVEDCTVGRGEGADIHGPDPCHVPRVVEGVPQLVVACGRRVGPDGAAAVRRCPVVQLAAAPEGAVVSGGAALSLPRAVVALVALLRRPVRVVASQPLRAEQMDVGAPVGAVGHVVAETRAEAHRAVP